MFRITRTSVAGFGATLLSSGWGDELLVLDLGGTVRDLSLGRAWAGPGAGPAAATGDVAATSAAAAGDVAAATGAAATGAAATSAAAAGDVAAATGAAAAAGPAAAAQPLLARCEPEAIAADPLFRGRLLFPFNDRIPQGRYRFAGQEHRLRINSPEDGSAIHGFLYRRTMERVGENASEDCARFVLRTRIRPGDEPGYPFGLSLRVQYELGRARCSLSFVLRNEGRSAAPYSLGWHPYFSLGGRVDDWVLTHGGERFVPVDEALLPRGGLEPTEGSPFDFRQGRRIGPGALDLALAAPDQGRFRLSRPGGSAIEIVAEPSLFPFTQLFVPPDRASIALEPISSPTDAFNRPELGLQILEAGEERRGSISVRRG